MRISFDLDDTLICYVEPAMLRYEGDPAYARHSAVRYGRACALLAGAVRDDAVATGSYRLFIPGIASDPFGAKHAATRAGFWLLQAIA